MVSVAKILELLPQEGSLEIKKLEKMLKLTKKVERTRLEIAITALSKIGLIELDTEATIKIQKLHTYIKAKIRCSSKGYCFAVREDNEEDIYIREQHLNHAWHGDYVLVKIEREALKRRSPEGSVICILERSKKRLLANIIEENGEVIASPLDERILSKIELPSLESPYKTDSENIVEVEITKYPIAQYKAVGKVIRNLSLKAGFQGDIEIIKTKFCIDEENKPPKISTKRPPDKHRRSLLAQNVVLFKSWLSKDSPPLLATYAEPFKGGIKAWIHIPSVSERILLDSKLGIWIKERAESRCIGNRWINLLSNTLIKESGFKVNEENDAITLEIIINKEGEIKDWEFYLSKICPKVEVTDEILDKIVNRKPRSRTIPSVLKDIKEYILNIETILFLIKLINNNLKSNGLIEFKSNYYNTDKLYDHCYTNPGKDFYGWKEEYDPKSANSIVSVLTTISNIIFFKYSQSLNMNMIYTKSRDIDAIQYNEIVKSAIALDTKVELNEDGIIDLNKFIETIKGEISQNVIEKLLRNIIPERSYELYKPESNDSDKELLLESITLNTEAPWSSPTINYADILNQSLLVELINLQKNKSIKKEDIISANSDVTKIDISSKIKVTPIKTKVSNGIINFLNNEQTRSKLFRSGLISIIEARAIDEMVGSSVDGIITGVQSYGIFVEIDKFQAEGLVHVSTLDDDWYEYRSRQNLLIGRKNKKTYQLGKQIKIKIISVDLLKNQIDLEVFRE